MSDPFVGRTIAHYEVVARVGGGAMGVVYQARDTKLGRLVALKFLPQQWSHDENARQRFVREAQAASATHHPNICTIHDIERTDDGQLFIVMALYEGLTLKQRLESGPIGIEEALDIATQIAEGLAKAHAQSVVHRDIKPGNVILTEDGVRILDFGLATFADALKLTTENAPVGTVAYMSPEQVRGRAADARSDVWALGAVLYEMLAGHVPFQGSHAEAIAHAILNESPQCLRAIRPEVSEEIEQLVFRALHKEVSVRFQSGRELARALRQVRGLSVPLELRTAPITLEQPVAVRRSTRRVKPWAMAATVILLIAAGIWLLRAVEPVPVTVVPVVNLTGYDALTPFTLALTQELESELEDVTGIRVSPHDRLLEVVRPFQRGSGDLSSREAMQAIATHTGAHVLIVPTILREGVGWKARVELRDPATGVSERFETSPVVSSLMKDAVYGLMPALTAEVADRFAAGPALVGRTLRRLFNRPRAIPRPRMRSLDAVAEFEKGLDAYERNELQAAREAFANAAARDSSNPLSFAWQSRIATLMRRDQEAVQAATQALRLIGDDTRETDRLFVEAVSAEARRDMTTARTKYQTLVERDVRHTGWLLERAGFEDRRGPASDSVATYHAALTLDGSLVRPHVELCRLYVPTRLNEPALAKRHGEQALKTYIALGNSSGQAQARWCLADVFRYGSDADRLEAKRHADAALDVMQTLGSAYGLSRAYNYVALVAWSGRHGAEAATSWEKALDLSRQVGNVLLESRTLMNLGVVQEFLGHRAAALEYYRDSSSMFEASGNEQDAARAQINAAAIQLRFGVEPEQGLLNAQNAQAVFEEVGDKDFEVFARLNIAAYHRNVGRLEDAARELTVAETLARQNNLDTKLPVVVLELAGTRLDAGKYREAGELFRRIIGEASLADRVQARIGLARVETRLGDFSAAQKNLDEASKDLEQHGDIGARPTLWLAQGEWAYESGSPVEARAAFTRGAAMWTAELPVPSAVEARAYLGLLDALQGKQSGVALIVDGVTQARRMRRVILEARCQLFLARSLVRQRRFDAALAALDQVSVEIERALAPELRAQLHYWRGQAWAGRGDRDKAAAAADAADRFLMEARRLVPEPYQERVLLRQDFRLIQERHTPAK